MAAEILSTLIDLSIALGIGLLIGLQREHSGAGPLAAGSRTFPLVATAGAVCQAFFPRVLPVALAGVVVLAALGYWVRVRGSGDPGLATPIAIALTFLLGAMAATSDDAQVLAVILGVVVTVVLAAKEPLHGFARRLSAEEVRATLVFLVVALVVLPLLPNEPIDRLLGLNPRFVWTMVVFVSAMDLASYLFVRAFATRRGNLLAGVVGGLVSSTAATVSMARRTRAEPTQHAVLRIGIVAASVVMLARMVIEVAVVHPPLLALVGLPLAALAAWCALVIAAWLRRPMAEDGAGPGPRNPFRLTPALLFGAAFAAILLATTWIHEGFGDAGVYGAAVLSGFVDVDAVTLTMARLAATGALSPGVAGAGILLVAASNFCFKVGLVLALGTRRLALGVGTALLAAPLVAGVALALW